MPCSLHCKYRLLFQGHFNYRVTDSMDQRHFGVALFGLGRAGSIHFHNLRKTPRADLLYIVEQDVEKAKAILATHRMTATQVLAPGQSLTAIQDPRVQAVVIATPTYTHQATVLQAVANEKAVFCEKPIAENVKETKKCYEAAAEKKVPLLCSFNRRYDPTLMKLREQLQSGAIGRAHLVSTVARDHPRPPNSYLEISGGFFHDCAVHDLDLICWLLNAWPTKVHCFSQVYDEDIRKMDDCDTAAISMQFADGAIGQINLSRHATYGYDQRLEVMGDRGMLQCNNQSASSLAVFGAEGVKQDPLKHSFPQRYAESYVNALDNFFDILEGKKEQDVTMESTLTISKLASACEESARTGQTIIMEEFVLPDH